MRVSFFACVGLLVPVLMLVGCGSNSGGGTQTAGGYSEVLVMEVGRASANVGQILASGRLLPPAALQFSPQQRASYSRLLEGASNLSMADLESLDQFEPKVIGQASGNLRQLRQVAAELHADIVTSAAQAGATPAIRDFVKTVNQVTTTVEQYNGGTSEGFEIGLRLDHTGQALVRAAESHRLAAQQRLAALARTETGELGSLTERQKHEEGQLHGQLSALAKRLYAMAVDRTHPEVARFVADVERAYPEGIIDDAVVPRR